MTLLIPAFALVRAPPVLTLRLLRRAQRSPTIPMPVWCPLVVSLTQDERRTGIAIHSFGTMLEPRYVVGARALDQ
jgi:hypothetical protein